MKKEKGRELFVVVDLETTGGQARHNAITELAIVLHDGERELERYQSLLQPGQAIPYRIQQLTGIDDNMVADAPEFAAEAPRILALLDKHIFVAHNVNFDYSFIRESFRRAGYEYNARRLCTVRYARKLLPGLPSYSLGPLTRHLNLHNRAPHRAWGDTEVTAALLAKLMERDHDQIWRKMVKFGLEGELSLPPHLPQEHYLALPEAPGVYYFLNQVGRPLYIGKAKNIRKRVAQHFSAGQNSSRKMNLGREIYALRFELTGNEWLAMALEDCQIRVFFPPYNRAQKRKPKRYGLFTHRNQNGEGSFLINQLQGQSNALRVFLNLDNARSWLQKQARVFGLEPKLMGYTLPWERQVKPVDHEQAYQNFLQYLKQSPPYEYTVLAAPKADQQTLLLLREDQLINWKVVDRDTQLEPNEILASLEPLAPSATTEALVRQLRMDPSLSFHLLPADFSLYNSLL